MKNYPDKEKTFFWEKSNYNLIIRHRLVKRIYALMITFILILIAIFEIIILFIESPFLIFYDIITHNIELFISLLFTLLIILILIISLFWQPIVAVINNNNFIYYPIEYLPFIKIKFNNNDIKEVKFVEKYIYSGYRGASIKDTNWKLVVELLNNKNYEIALIDSQYIPDYYKELRKEIDIIINSSTALNKA